MLKPGILHSIYEQGKEPGASEDDLKSLNILSREILRADQRHLWPGAQPCAAAQASANAQRHPEHWILYLHFAKLLRLPTTASSVLIKPKNPL